MTGNGHGNGSNTGYTKFLFVIPRRDDDGIGGKLRTAGGIISRGFFNDYDADGTRDGQPHETIQFLVGDNDQQADSGIAAARYAVQVCGKYRPRLTELEQELRRRLGDAAEILSLDGAVRQPRYTSADLYDYAYKRAVPRKSGRIARNALILPLSKSKDWWAKPALERHAFFYPHVDANSGCPAHGHAMAAQEGIPTLFRRLYHNPDGYERAGEFDFVTYFECEDEHVETFEKVHTALRDTSRNPEWRYVTEGPLWRGRRVLRW